MTQPFEGAGRLGIDFMNSGLKSLAAMSRGMQAITTEAADYSRKTCEEAGTALGRMTTATSIEIFEIQADYARMAYEGLLAEATRMGDLYATTAKEACKPFESVVADGK